MATIKEDYCDFETAKLLKEKGFNEACWSWYHNGNNTHTGTSRYCNSELEKYDFSKATLAHVMKWLREVHGLHISLEPCYDYDSMHVIYLAFVQNVTNVHEFMDGRKNVASYPNAEKSCELAIKYCLENLI